MTHAVPVKNGNCHKRMGPYMYRLYASMRVISAAMPCERTNTIEWPRLDVSVKSCCIEPGIGIHVAITGASSMSGVESIAGKTEMLMRNAVEHYHRSCSGVDEAMDERNEEKLAGVVAY